MEFFDVIKLRRSIRVFKDEQVEEDKVKQILEAANSAPSAGNLQAYEIVLVKSKEQKSKLADAAFGQDFVLQAPIVIIFLANLNRCSAYGKRGEQLYCIQDATIAASYAQLAATALGLGSVWVGAFDDNEVKKIVRGEGMKPVAIIPIGYPAETPRPTKRRSLNDIVHEEKIDY